jgi:hypothetical protein
VQHAAKSARTRSQFRSFCSAGQNAHVPKATCVLSPQKGEKKPSPKAWFFDGLVVDGSPLRNFLFEFNHAREY